MKIWLTNQGGGLIKTIAEKCKRETYRLVVVVGRNQPGPLLNILNRLCGKEIPAEELDNIDNLSQLPVMSGNRLIILHSLASRSVGNPVEYLRLYCRRMGYETIFVPCSIRRIDLEYLYQNDLDTGLKDFDNRWFLDIAHETALWLSAGILNCYYDLRDNLIKAFEGNPLQLPDAQQCLEDYQSGLEQEEETAYVKRRFRGNGGMDRLLRDPDDEDWLVLWSVGLAGQFNGKWYLSPFLLDSPKLYRERQHRLQRAVNSTLIPIYQAWVLYCQKKYSLRELDEDKKLIPWYPKNVLEALQLIRDADPDDVSLSREVRALRNWVQHDDADERNVPWVDHRQNRAHALYTCAKVIRMLDPDGNLK